MKIFQVVNVRWFNATAWYALYLSKLLNDEGHDVTILTLAGTASEQKAKEFGLKTISVNLNTTNPLTLLKEAAKVVSLLKKHRPDIVNCHRGEGFFLWGLFKCLGYGYRLVRTRGDQRLPRSDAFNRWLHAHVTDAVVVTNRKMAQHFLHKMNTPESMVWLIHGGVDQKRFKFDQAGRDVVRKEFGFKPTDHVIGLLGRFDRVKGHQELIEAIAKLREQGRDNIRLFLIGFDTAMDSQQITQCLKKYNIEDITAISGKREDIVACISALDTAVVASLWSEAIARAALEIMAVGRLLISTDVGVMPDLVPPAALVPPGDSKALASTLLQAIENEEFQEEALRHHAATMSQLDGKDFLNRTLNLYTGLLEHN